MIAGLMSDLARAEYPGNVFVPASATGLRRDSIAITTEVSTIDLDRVLESAGVPPRSLLDDVDRGLRLSLAL